MTRRRVVAAAFTVGCLLTVWLAFTDNQQPSQLGSGDRVPVYPPGFAPYDVTPSFPPGVATTAVHVHAASAGRGVPVASWNAARGSVWDALQACECPQGWHCNTGNGYYGGLQFSAATWRQAGGTQYAAYAHQATREQQIAVAEAWLARTSWAQWPHCSRVLGLR